MKSFEDQIRKIIHVDMDAFYASVEQRDFPEYRNKPVIVGGSPQGSWIGQMAYIAASDDPKAGG